MTFAQEESLRRRAMSFSAKKYLGQNFLVNKETLQEIANALLVQPNEEVLEIGPGLGFLTEILVGYKANVTAIEIDPDCVNILKHSALENLTIIEDDFLKVDLLPILNQPTKIAGNIPYNITSPIIVKLLGEIGQPTPYLTNIKSFVFTLQEEVAKRLVATPGHKDYSQITLLMNYFGTAELLFKIPPANFFPVPKVSSAVVRFTPHNKPKVSCKNHSLLRKVIKVGFTNRRKMLKNNLRSLSLTDVELNKIFFDLNFDPEVRAEYLSLEQFAKLADAIE